ncbi:polysaccharide deacetylase family protein [Candidatus Absconditicoccus praedator]|uniref:polysaccharide deacetylase family protein n=1 Tax=Candidatus Absconditicoccus praedator TaxID=2735562 RepID=UPI001E2CD831|nr:polysaccharide deacetylase family protein [Candidatus Absconditicoccus praedator]UFX82983.1 polysaccharide deacetylase family protein [Candidatus Absconditicoccus praedator]
MKTFIILIIFILGNSLGYSYLSLEHSTKPNIKKTYINKTDFENNIKPLRQTIKNQKNIETIQKKCKSNIFPKNKYLLTFDDGPYENITKEILEILNQYDVNAVFFLLGKNIIKNPHLINKIVKNGHILGNHTFTHRSLKKLNYTQTKNEIKSTNLLINNILGFEYPIKLFRPPYGKRNSSFDQIMQNKKLTGCFWNFDTLDWQVDELGVSKNEIKNNIKTQIQKNPTGGKNILFHDVEKVTPKLLPYTIEKLKKYGNSSIF